MEREDEARRGCFAFTARSRSPPPAEGEEAAVKPNVLAQMLRANVSSLWVAASQPPSSLALAAEAPPSAAARFRPGSALAAQVHAPRGLPAAEATLGPWSPQNSPRPALCASSAPAERGRPRSAHTSLARAGAHTWMSLHQLHRAVSDTSTQW